MAYWTNHEIKKLQELWTLGLSTAEIGAQINNRSGSSVRQQAKRLGLPPKNHIMLTKIKRRRAVESWRERV